MAMNTVINTNMMALTAHRNLGTVGNRQNKANQRLSSGKKINSAADDAAGLAIADKMKAQIKGLDMASKNAEDATSLIQTAEGSLTEVTNMVQRLRELTVQGINDTNTKEDRAKIVTEMNELVKEIDAIARRTEFNGKVLTSGKFSKSPLRFQIGANADQLLNLSIGPMHAKQNGLSLTKLVGEISKAFLDTEKASAASNALKHFDTALAKVATQRAKLGATQNRLEYTINNLNISSENLSAAKSRIEDADMAKEMMNLTSANVLQQAATSMLAQANQAPNSITQLLG